MLKIIETAFFILFAGTGVGILASLYTILARYPIAHAARIFHIVLIFPMVLSGLAAIFEAFALVQFQTTLFGIPIIVYTFTFLIGQFVTWWTFVAGAVYYASRRG